jgi:eukaryotic-like serine/threonine-protein kinase
MTLDRDTLLNGRYRIVEILGQGGMASVYRAIDENLGVEVSVKENLFTTEEYAKQFRREAIILASLRHPNLPRVTDHFVIEHEGQYLVMDYIEGEDLRQRMDRIGALPEQEVIVIGVAICDALSYMHARTLPILHRDIKPGNVKITPLGEIYLVDFGLAKVVEGRQVTSTGARAMTPGFSPPEQYGSARTDHRSDIYSLGATLYAALTEVIPEDGLSRAMGQAVLTPISHHNPKVSRRLAGVIEKALEIRPQDRYQRADEFMRDLLNARNTTRRNLPMELILTPPPFTHGDLLHDDQSNGGIVESIAVPGNDLIPPSFSVSTPITHEIPRIIPPPKKHIPRRVFLFFAYLIVIFAGGTALYMLNPDFRQIAQAAYRSIEIPERISYILQGGTSLLSTPTPTTTRQLGVALAATSTWTIEASPTSTDRPLPSSTRRPTFTPSPIPTPRGGGSGLIVFASDRLGVPNIYIINVDGTNIRQVTDIAEGACQPDWSPDGGKIVFTSPCSRNQESYQGSGLFIINSDGSGLIPLPSAPGGDYDPDWSPDGSKIAFTTLREGGMATIYIIDIDSGLVSKLLDESTGSYIQPAWAPDKDVIAFIGGDNRIMGASVSKKEIFSISIGESEFKNSNPAWSPDGSKITFSQRRLTDDSGATWLMSVTYSDKAMSPFAIPNFNSASEPSYSPDGYWLVHRTWDTGNHDIAVMGSTGSIKLNLLNDQAYDFDPDWNPAFIVP